MFFKHLTFINTSLKVHATFSCLQIKYMYHTLVSNLFEEVSSRPTSIIYYSNDSTMLWTTEDMRYLRAAVNVK